MYKLRLSKSINIHREDFFDVVARAKSEGLEALDFDLCGKVIWTRQDAEGYRKLEKALEAVKASGLPINGVHIPYGRQWDISDTDENTRTGAVENFKEIAPLIDRYCPRCYVIHGSYEPIPVEDRAARLEALKRSLCEMTEITNTTLAVEILPRTCLFNTSAEAIATLDAVNSDQIKICVDVNHFLQEKSEDGVLALGDRIVTTHISDHDYADERHWLPLEGKIDWMALIAAFEKIGYDGAFNYECGTSVAEVKANYDKLFAEYNK